MRERDIERWHLRMRDKCENTGERRTQHRTQYGQNVAQLRDIVTERRLERVLERRMTVKKQSACS
eukprot:6906446-Prorocentrum_lima.AAC.1